MREFSVANYSLISASALLLFLSTSCGNKIQFADSSREPSSPDPSSEVVEENSIIETSSTKETRYADSNSIAAEGGDSRGSGAAEDLMNRENFPKDTLFNSTSEEDSNGQQNVEMPVRPGVAAAQVTVPVGDLSVRELCKIRPLVKRSFDVFFGERKKECAWNKGDNLNPVDGIVRARSEEKIKLRLAANETICGISFTSPEQTIRFDDELLLTFNDNVVMSSYNYNSRFQTIGGLVKYAWLELVDGYNPGIYNRGISYCLGVPAEDQTNCVVPPSEAPGRLYLKVPDEAAQKLSISSIKENRAEIGLIVTGDNDAVDCQYSDISFKVEMMVAERL